MPGIRNDDISSNSNLLDLIVKYFFEFFNGIEHLQNETWNWRKVSSFCKQVDRKEVLLGYKEYPLLGVSLEGRGPFVRETKVGSEISGNSRQRVEKGDFIYSRLFAWKGSFGMITEETDGCYCSNEFPIFRCDETVLEEFLLLYYLQPSTWRIVESFCTGTTKASRNRFKEQYFLDMEVPIPPLGIQEKLVSHHKQVKQIIAMSHVIALQYSMSNITAMTCQIVAMSLNVATTCEMIATSHIGGTTCKITITMSHIIATTRLLRYVT